MADSLLRSRLEAEHLPNVIRQRLSAQPRHDYLADAVLGAVDGCITTFAIVAGSVGAGFSALVIIVLGFANLLADGFSMAVSNYLGTKSERERIDKARRIEQQHIDHFPEGEREEIRQIFEQKGFNGTILDNIVEVITSNPRLWINTMLTEELGLQAQGRHPVRAGVATFAAFVIVGLVPLLPFLLPQLDPRHRFVISCVSTAIAFTAVGVVKGLLVEKSPARSGVETLLTGGTAASLAYFIGAWLQRAYGAS